MTVKKDFVELVNLLETNKNKKVSDIMSLVLELVTSQKKPKTFRTDDSGRITEIFCYYHKKWEPVELYGTKTSSHTGYNTMCKTGVNQWTKQQKEAEKSRTEVLTAVQNGDIKPEHIQVELDKIEQHRLRIVPLV